MRENQGSTSIFAASCRASIMLLQQRNLRLFPVPCSAKPKAGSSRKSPHAVASVRTTSGQTVQIIRSNVYVGKVRLPLLQLALCCSPTAVSSALGGFHSIIPVYNQLLLTSLIISAAPRFSRPLRRALVQCSSLAHRPCLLPRPAPAAAV